MEGGGLHQINPPPSSSLPPTHLSVHVHLSHPPTPLCPGAGQEQLHNNGVFVEDVQVHTVVARLQNQLETEAKLQKNQESEHGAA